MRGLWETSIGGKMRNKVINWKDVTSKRGPIYFAKQDLADGRIELSIVASKDIINIIYDYIPEGAHRGKTVTQQSFIKSGPGALAKVLESLTLNRPGNTTTKAREKAYKKEWAILTNSAANLFKEADPIAHTLTLRITSEHAAMLNEVKKLTGQKTAAKAIVESIKYYLESVSFQNPTKIR